MKIISFLWSLRQQFTKYFIVGLSGVAIDMATLVLFKEVFDITPVIAVFISQIFAIITVFTLNKVWSFQSPEQTKRQFARFSVVVVVDYFLAVIIMYIFNHQLEFDYRLVRLATIALMVSWNFFLYKYWVYPVK